MSSSKTDSYEKKNAERLAKIMRENLMKRKQQQRARKSVQSPEKPSHSKEH